MKNSAINIKMLFLTAIMAVILLLSPRDTSSQEISGINGSINYISSESAIINDYTSAEIDFIFMNKTIETLIIKDENVNSVSPDVKNLYLLKVLDLAGTKIDVLPEEISQLRCLEEIHLNSEMWQYRLDDVKRLTRAKIVIE